MHLEVHLLGSVNNHNHKLELLASVKINNSNNLLDHQVVGLAFKALNLKQDLQMSKLLVHLGLTVRASNKMLVRLELPVLLRHPLKVKYLFHTIFCNLLTWFIC